MLERWERIYRLFFNGLIAAVAVLVLWKLLPVLGDLLVNGGWKPRAAFAVLIGYFATMRLVARTVRFRAFVMYWHTRSLSPERLWGDFYQRLLGEIRNYRVWFGTGQQVVNWFRIRRALRFEQALFAEDGLHLKIAGPSLDGRLPFVVRIRYPRPCTSGRSSIASTTCDYSDIPWKGEAELTLVQ